LPLAIPRTRATEIRARFFIGKNGRTRGQVWVVFLKTNFLIAADILVATKEG
jgi:hypothetical protein